MDIYSADLENGSILCLLPYFASSKKEGRFPIVLVGGMFEPIVGLAPYPQ